jgi:hypothetical protein
MSSDESDYGELTRNPPARARPPRYYVLQPLWRHTSLSSWLETFDVVYCIIRRVGLNRRGAYARQRQQNSMQVRYSTNKSFVRELSVSTYDVDWLAGCGDRDFVVLPSPEMYSFTHNPEIIRYAVIKSLEMFCTYNYTKKYVRYIQSAMIENLTNNG